MPFDRFIRFVDENGSTVYGNLEHEMNADQIVGSKVALLAGDPLGGFSKTAVKRTVKKVIVP